MTIPMEAMELEHCFLPEEIAERLTQMCRSKHEINNTECTDKPEELVDVDSEDNTDEGVKPPHNVPDCLKDTVQSTCNILYCVNFFNMCIVMNCSFFSVFVYVYLLYLQCMCVACCSRLFLLFLILCK